MKKHLLIIIGSILLLAACGNDDNANANTDKNDDIINEQENNETENEGEENVNSNNNLDSDENNHDNEYEMEEVVPDSLIVEHDELTFAEFTIENIIIEKDEDELIFNFWWINQSGEDQMPFTALGYIDVSQGEDYLEEISGAYDPDNKTEILFRNAYGGSHPVTLIYELKNDEDVEILVGTTLESGEKKETITVELK